MAKERSQRLHVKRDRRAAPLGPARQVCGHVLERGGLPRSSASGEPHEEWRQRTPSIVERRLGEAAVVTQRPHKIIERFFPGDVSAHENGWTHRVTGAAMRNGESQLSVLVVKHDRTSSLNLEVRSIADAYVW